MEFKFRAKVKVKSSVGRILRPDGVTTQAVFFEGTEGIVIRHDPVKGGYLVVLHCPEVSAAMGETITAYFNANELEPIATAAASDVGLAAGLPFEYPNEAPLSGYAAQRARNNKAKRIADA
jgi:hypothetical protein